MMSGEREAGMQHTWLRLSSRPNRADYYAYHTLHVDVLFLARRNKLPTEHSKDCSSELQCTVMIRVRIIKWAFICLVMLSGQVQISH